MKENRDYCIFPFFLCWSFCEKWIYLIAPEMGPWLLRKSEDQSGGPRTSLEVFDDEVTFQFTVKCWKVDFLMSSKTRSSETLRESFVWSVFSSRTPLNLEFQPEFWKSKFLWKTRFLMFLVLFCNFRLLVWLLPLEGVHLLHSDQLR